jgi:hypothetical protein
MLSISVMEDMGFFIMFKKWKVLIHLEGDNPDTIVCIGVRQGKLYRFKGKLV